jgi:hypothetical protein
MNVRNLASRLAISFAITVLFIAPGSAVAMADEESRTANLPDAPIPKQQNPSQQLQATIAILGKRSVFFPELAFDKGPLDPWQKFELSVDETIAPSRFLGSMITAGIGQARNALPGVRARMGWLRKTIWLVGREQRF